MLKVLGSVRLSRDTETTTSPARQRERIEWWASGNEGQLVHVAEDLDVSGAAYPFDRPELGAWLTDQRADEWDVLVAWKLDRISRSSMDTEKLLKWCIDRGKRIVCVDDGIDTSTQMGQVWVKLASIFAEVERNSIKERTAKGKAKLAATGRWSGEAVHYGYRAVQHPDGWRLEIEPEAYSTLRYIISRVLDGEHVRSIAEELTDAGVPSPRDHQRKLRGKEVQGKPWNSQTIFKILSSRTLLGHTVSKGEPLIIDGDVVQKAEPLVTFAEFDLLQKVVKNRRWKKENNPRSNASPLLHVAYCLECEGPLYQRTHNLNETQYRYYYCRSKCTQSIKAEELEVHAEDAFLFYAGDAERYDEEFVPASDATAELESAKDTLEDLIQSMQRANSKAAREVITDQISRVDERISRLEQQPVQAAYVKTVPTGRSYREEWESRDTEGRRMLLTTGGIKIYAKLEGRGRARGEAGDFQAQLVIPPEILDRLHATKTP